MARSRARAAEVAAAAAVLEWLARSYLKGAALAKQAAEMNNNIVSRSFLNAEAQCLEDFASSLRSHKDEDLLAAIIAGKEPL